MTGEVAVASVEWDVIDLAESCPGVTIVGFLDPDMNAKVRHVAHLGPDSNWHRLRAESPDLRVVLAMDDPKLRAKLYDEYSESCVATLISPSAHVSRWATLGPGAIVQRHVNIMPFATLGRACKINVGAAIHHEAVVGDFVTVAPRASVLGRVVIEDGAYIGAGAIIRQHCRVGCGALVGAGAVVVSDVPAGAVVVGVPANRRLS